MSRITPGTVISDIFWSGYGLNYKHTRVVPSGGALFPLELYGVIMQDVGRIKKGVYHYSPSSNALELISEEDVFNFDSRGIDLE